MLSKARGAADVSLPLVNMCYLRNEAVEMLRPRIRQMKHDALLSAFA